MHRPDEIAETRKLLEAAGVQYCFAAYVDIHGVPKAKTVPLDCFEKMCAGSELYTVGAMEGMGLIGPEQDECAAVPDLDSLMIFPWDRRFAWFAADLHHHGAPYPNCSRVILKRAAERARARGFTFNLGVEMEFYVFRAGTEGPAPLQTRPHKGLCPGYDIHQTIQSMPYLDRLVEAMNALGWRVYSFDAEGGQGQFEIDFAYADALSMADRLVFFRFMAKTLAQEMGLVASFMPKPFATDFRSGAHFNMSLADASGQNLFAGPPGALAAVHGIPFPDIGYHFVAGLLAHADALTAVTCPSHNSYKGLLAQGRMVDMSWAPVLRAYGRNNRSAMLRLPMNRPCVENRTPDVGCNFHLAAAMSLEAGLAGVAAGADPGRPMNDNLYLRLDKPTAAATLPLTDGGSVSRLPRTLLEALAAFEADPLAAEALGAEMRDIFLAWKLREWERDFYAVDAPERERMLAFV